MECVLWTLCACGTTNEERTVTNKDPENGIAYGVIPQNALHPDFIEDAEYDYGTPEEAECPECGTVICTGATDHEWGDEIECPECGEEFEIELPDGAEANSFTIEKDGYAISGECGSYTSTFDLWVLKSPYCTMAEGCSPCAPGAGYILNEGGMATYCLGPDWFEDGVAPYKLLDTDTLEETE